MLILSITAGQGHNATARAVQDAMEMIPGCEAVVLDTFKYVDNNINRTIDKGYTLGVRFSPKTWGQLYEIAYDHTLSERRLSVSRMLRGILANKLVTFIQKYQPDVIICTHCFPALLMANLRQKGKINAKLMGVLTDFTLHPYWQDIDMEAFVIADARLMYGIAKKGIDPAIMYPLGIPIQPKFSITTPKTEARKQLDIPDRPTVLLMSGSFGFGEITQHIRALDALPLPFQIISISGSNTRLKKRVDDMETAKTVFRHGFVNNVDVMMDAADCIVTKPGGITTSEALAKHLPLVMVNPIPGQEARNAAFLTNCGVGMEVRDSFPVDEAVHALLSHPAQAQAMRMMQKDMGKPYAARDVAHLAYKLCGKTVPEKGSAAIAFHEDTRR